MCLKQKERYALFCFSIAFVVLFYRIFHEFDAGEKVYQLQDKAIIKIYDEFIVWRKA